jgi:hypothetical protein
VYTDFVHPDTTLSSASSSNESIVAAIRPSANGIALPEIVTCESVTESVLVSASTPSTVNLQR